MPTKISGARHRAARRPAAQLFSLVPGPATRRGLLTVASSSLVLTMAATTATAAPTATMRPRADVTTISADAVSAMVTGVRVSIPTDITWSVDAIATAEATPPPPPPPPPVPEPVVEAVREAPAASRSAERAELAPAPAA
ncbi:hypothetical protein GB881_19355, partial [Georgenia subflava]|nr:hypothetical protein [Georgenia subflava]